MRKLSGADATLVRGLIVPSLMVMIGRLNWWPPRRSALGGGELDRSPDLYMGRTHRI